MLFNRRYLLWIASVLAWLAGLPSTASAHPVPLAHATITIEADGYLPWDQEVDAGDSGGLIKLDVKLVKRPD